MRSVRAQILAPGLGALQAESGSSRRRAHRAAGHECSFADAAAEQLAYALELMDVRGEIDPASPEAQKFVEDYVRQVTMHEVGHTLGLRHNFRASRAYTEAQLADPEFTAAHGTVASVMEYMPINLNAPGERRALYGTPFNTALGPYDYWAIEYAYRPLEADGRGRRARAHRRRAAPSRCSPSAPTRTRASASTPRRCSSTSATTWSPSRASASRSRRTCCAGRRFASRAPTRATRCCAARCSTRVNDVGRAAGMLARQIGGVRTLRDAPGSGRDPLQPVPAAQQREALALITGSLLAADSLRVSPALQRRLAPDFLARREAMQAGDAAGGTDFSFATQLLEMQRGLLGALMSDTVAVRLLDSAEKAGRGADGALRLSELYASLDAGGVERARGGPATSRRCGANCSANTSTGSRACCCARRRSAAPTRAACCACRRRALAGATRRGVARRGAEPGGAGAPEGQRRHAEPGAGGAAAARGWRPAGRTPPFDPAKPPPVAAAARLPAAGQHAASGLSWRPMSSCSLRPFAIDPLGALR